MLSYRLDQAEKDIGGLGGKIERQQEEIGSIQRAQTSLEHMLERMGESINSKIEHLGKMLESEREGSKAILQAVKDLPGELQKKNFTSNLADMASNPRIYVPSGLAVAMVAVIISTLTGKPIPEMPSQQLDQPPAAHKNP